MKLENIRVQSAEAGAEWVSAIKKYTGIGSRKLNSSLWQGKELDPDSQEVDRGLEVAFEKSAEVHRIDRLWVASDFDLPVKEGEKFVLPAWLSSSLFFNSCRIFGKKYYLIHNAIGLDVRDHSFANQTLNREDEIIIKKGQTVLVGESKKTDVQIYDSDTQQDNVIDIEYVNLYCVEE